MVNDYAVNDVENARLALLISKSTGLTTIGYGMTVNGSFTLAGSTSGGLIVKAPAIAGSNTLTLPAGTTDFSATGGTNRFVAQTSVGGVLTVVQPAFSNLSGSVAASQMPAFTGDITTSAGAVATTLATAQPAVHTWALAQTFTVAPVFTDASGSRTALGLGALATVTPGTGVAAALALNVGSAGAPVLFNGALGTPSSGAIATTLLTGTLQAAQEPAHTGDVTNSAGSLALSIAANAVTLAKLATQATNTVLANATSGTAVPTALAVASCDTATKALQWTTNTGFACNSAINAATLGGATFAAPGAIGSGTPSTGAFTTIAATGATITLSNAAPVMTINKAASGADNILTGQTNGLNRWIFDLGDNTAESGANAGSDFDINRYNDAGTFQAKAFSIIRSTGAVSIAATLSILGIASDTATVDNTMCITSAGLTLKGTGTLGICLGTSGAQFKTAFAPMAAGIDDLMKINFQNYRYRDGFGDNGARMQYGTTAQDVEGVIPDLVRYDAKGNAINYDSGALLFVGLRAIQQLKADNDNLRAEVVNLKIANK